MGFVPSPPAGAGVETATGAIDLRYEEVAQSGQVLLTVLPVGLAAIWRALLADEDRANAMRNAGVLPILAHMRLEGEANSVSVAEPMRARGTYQLGHTVDDQGTVDRIVLAMWAELDGREGFTHAPPDPDARRVPVGRVFAQHVFTRPFEAVTNRKVLSLELPGVPKVPSARFGWVPLEKVAALPPGAHPLGPLEVDPSTLVFGLAHTDSNQHVNSMVYPRVFEEAALRRFSSIGKGTAELLSVRCELAWRKPCFAGDRVQVSLSPYALEERLGAYGVFLPEGQPNARPYAAVRMEW